MAHRITTSTGHSQRSSVSTNQPASDCVLAVSQDGCITGANQIALDLLGYPLKKLVGKPLAAVLGGSGRRRHPSASLPNLLGEPVPVELTLYTRDNRPVPVLFHSTRLALASESDVFVCYAQPKTAKSLKEWKAVQADLLRQTQDQFLANMTHELRTPLTGILGMSQILEESELTEKQKIQLETISRCGSDLLRLINRVLDFKAIRTPHTELQVEKFRLLDLVHEMLDRFEPGFSAKNLNCTVHADPDVPEVMVGDAGKLRSIVEALLDNAVKFTEQGDVGLRLVRETTQGNQIRLRISIRDTGIGIPASKQALVLEPFQQGDVSLTRRYGGGGLGLSLVRELVRAMHGELWLDSDPGWGSEFHVSLPLEIAPASLTDHDIVSKM